MRATRRKYLRRSVDKRIQQRSESRDGVLWSIDSDSTCRVKIQGSDELITCHFPRNQKARPTWLRVGNAVRLNHRAGVRGYIEVSGEGRAIPQPIRGGALPTPGSTGDGIVSGMIVRETTPPSNNVVVDSGTYRLNGVLYSFGGLTIGWPMMAEPTMVMGVTPASQMGNIGFNLEPAPSVGYFRYDLVVIGASREVEYVTGTAATSNPVMPTIPAGYILLRFILRVGGDTNIPNSRIGQYWTIPKASSVTLSYTTPFSWNEYDDTPEETITANVKDQYGYNINAPAGGWTLTFQKIIGTGQVYSATSGYNSDEVSSYLTSGHTSSFKYQRDQLSSPEIQPYFMVTVSSNPPVHAFIFDMILSPQIS